MKGFFNLKKSVDEDLVSGEIPESGLIYKDYWKVAMPAAVEGIFLNIILIADLVMVGKLGIAPAAAVGIVSQPKMIMQMIAKGMGTGVTAVIARRKGENRYEEMNSCVKQSFLITILIYIILTFFAWNYRVGIIKAMGANEDYIGYAVTYFAFLLPALFFRAMTCVLSAVEVALGRTKVILISSVIGNLVNVFLNYVFIFGKFGCPAMGIKGAAIATIIGEGTIFLILLVAVLFKNKDDGIDLFRHGTCRFSYEIMKPVFKVGGNSLFEQTFMRIGLVITAILIARLGTVAVGTNHYCILVWDLYYYFCLGMEAASASFAGRKIGENRQDLAVLYTKAAQKSGFVISIAVSLLLIVSRKGLFSLLIADPECVELGSKMMLIVAIIVIPQMQAQIQAATLRGAGDNAFIAIYSVFVSALLRSLLGYILGFKLGMGLLGFWISPLINELLIYGLTNYRIKKGIWLTKEL